MKTTHRVHGNRAIKAVSSQRKISAPPLAKSEFDLSEFTLPDKDSHPACVAIYDRENKVPVCKIPLTEAEFFNIKERASREGILSKDWIAYNLRKALLIPKDDGFDGLANNCAKVSSLLELLGTKFDAIANREGCKFEGEEVDHFIFGVQMIIDDSKKSLEEAYHAAFEANHPRVVALPVETGN